MQNNQGLAVYTLHPIVSEDPEQETKQCHDVMAVALEAFFCWVANVFAQYYRLEVVMADNPLDEGHAQPLLEEDVQFFYRANAWIVLQGSLYQ